MKLFLLTLVLISGLAACKKEDAWLDKKGTLADVVPGTLQDYQALLDNDYVMNNSYPALGILGSGNYYVTTSNWQAAYARQERNSYIWAPDIYEGEPGYDWNACYQVVSYANVVLDGLQRIAETIENSRDRESLKGGALFFRAFAFYNLLQLFASPYSASAADERGIPLRLDPDPNTRVSRSSLAAGYAQVIADLTEAETLLPVTVPFKTRPSKGAAAALLARVALTMGDNAAALTHATTALQLQNTLLDFNSLPVDRPNPLPLFQEGNGEVLFHAATTVTLLNLAVGSRTIVDSALYHSYADNDLRKRLFYRTDEEGRAYFRGQYTGTFEYFGGLATNELYLIRAEAHARSGAVAGALEDLNALLKTRFEEGTFTPYRAPDAPAALDLILAERRKELPFTGLLPWEDLRRLNKESRFARTLTRVLDGQIYTLPPGDNRYTYPIPDNEIRFGGLEQNPR